VITRSLSIQRIPGMKRAIGLPATTARAPRPTTQPMAMLGIMMQ
jgi:hypothetical protein